MMRYLPALVRSQWGQMPERKGATAIIDRFTAANVTPVLWQEEVDRIKSRKDDFGDKMTVKVRPNVREVVASYNFSDEGYGELVSKNISSQLRTEHNCLLFLGDSAANKLSSGICPS